MNSLVSFVRNVASSVDIKSGLLDADGLGITYITKRILAMPFPFQESGHFGKPIDNISTYLNKTHANQYMIWNLSEKTYDYNKFNNQVIEFRFPGYPSPPLEKIFSICNSIHGWLQADNKNIAIIHCQTGKGRTAAVIASYLAWSGAVKNPQRALQIVASKIHYPVQGLLIPTQQRYLDYLGYILEGRKPVIKPIILERVIMNSIPSFESDGGCRPYLQIFKNAKLVYTSTGRDTQLSQLRWYTKDDQSILFPVDLPLDGDILIRVRHLAKDMKRISMLRFGFHSGFIPAGNCRFTKEELDGAVGDNRFDKDFFMDFIFRDDQKDEVPDEAAQAKFWEQVAHRTLPSSPLANSPDSDDDSPKPTATATTTTEAPSTSTTTDSTASKKKLRFKFSLFGDEPDDENAVIEDVAAKDHPKTTSAPSTNTSTKPSATSTVTAGTPAVEAPTATPIPVAKPTTTSTTSTPITAASVKSAAAAAFASFATKWGKSSSSSSLSSTSTTTTPATSTTSKSTPVKTTTPAKPTITSTTTTTAATKTTPKDKDGFADLQAYVQGLGSIDMTQVDAEDSDTEVAFDDLAAEIEHETKSAAPSTINTNPNTNTNTATNTIQLPSSNASQKKHSGDSSSDDSYVHVASVDVPTTTSSSSSTTSPSAPDPSSAKNDDFDLEAALLSHTQSSAEPSHNDKQPEVILGDDAEANLLAMLSTELSAGDAQGQPTMDDDELMRALNESSLT